MTIGERIKECRESLGMTQVALAEAINEKKQTLYKYENNIITNIPIKKVELIADALHTTPAYLMGWEIEKAPSQKDDDLDAYLEMLRTRPECRMLFKLADNATKEDVEKAIAIIEALRQVEKE